MSNSEGPTASLAVRVKTLSRRNGHARLRFGKVRGGSLIEFALVLPMLLLIVTGICTFGIALNNYLMLTDSVGTGARLLAISRGQTTDPCATTAAAVYNAAPLLVPASFSFSFVLNGTSYSGASCSSSSVTTGAAGNLVQGQPAQVTVTYPCSLSVYGINYAPNCTLKAQVTELVQ
jgi:Flp pilus assembly protein TadG